MGLSGLINWVCSEVTGDSVLDIGCSFDLIFMLAQKGKRVMGISSEEGIIADVHHNFIKESNLVKNNIRLLHFNILEKELNMMFDTVVLTNSNITEYSITLLMKIKDLIDESGTVILAIPFGDSDNFNNRTKGFLQDLFEEIGKSFEITDVKIFGDGLGIVAKKIIKNNKNNIPKLNTQYIRDQILIAQLKYENMQLNMENNHIKLELNNYKQKIEDLERSIENKNKEILSRLDSEENTLKKFKDFIHEYNRVEAKYYNVSKKYDLLSNAKLGKLTINYWKIKKRIPRDF